MEAFLKLPNGELSMLAHHQRLEELKGKLENPPAPLFKEVREWMLRKCVPGKEKQLRAIFEKQAFGELEHLVTQKLLDVVKGVAQQELARGDRLWTVAQQGDLGDAPMPAFDLEFLNTDIFNLSIECRVPFLEPLIESWDIDLETFGMEIVLNQRVAQERVKRLEYVEREPRLFEEPGFQEFLHDPQLSSDTTEEEITFLKRLRFKTKRPTPLYYYRELQNLRDPLHFRSG
jgi:hypothetical protein